MEVSKADIEILKAALDLAITEWRWAWSKHLEPHNFTENDVRNLRIALNDAND